ncbi:MAG: transporter substrate-binding domain-containing protein [Anaerolineaceae bacterium]|nr:transporter substrate-binding domain-containing protein [Anaerolineaceae bacterium]
MKKYLLLSLVVILLIITFAGGVCAADLLDEIQSKGQITIAMEGTWSPWTFHNEDDELVGYDVEVGKALAERLGVKPNFVEGPWDGLLAGLEVGRYDIMINGVGITEERQKKYDFSVPYAYNKPVVIVRGDYDEIHTMEDLKGKKTANTITSLFAETAEKYGANVIGVDDLNQTLELVLSGRIDATLNTEVTYFEYMRAHPEANLKIAAYGEDVTEIGIPLRKGEEIATLKEAINAALADMAENGVLTELSEKYFNTDISKK